MTTNEPNNHGLYVPKKSRRDFLRTGIAAGTAAAMSSATHAFAAPGDEIKIGLIGCGGRGSGAAGQALSSGNYNFKLWAMADAHQDRLDSAAKNLANKNKEQFAVTDERKFVGLDAYEKVLATCDLVILATPPGFRPYHFEAAVNAGKHVFMEKPVAVDAPGVRKVLEMGKVAASKGLKVVAGLQRRYQNCYREALKQVKENNIIGDIVGGQVYWNSAGVWVKEREAGQTELQYQLRNWYYFNWLCGDHINEQHIHNIDVANWFIGSTPVSAQGMGGRQVRTGKEFGEIYDHHYVEYTYANGVRINSQCRHQKNCENPVREEFAGTKGILYLDNGGRCYANDYKGNTIWRYRPIGEDRKDPDPYQTEHNELQDAILNGKPLNNAEYVAHSTMTSILGRFATYTGKEIKWEQALNSTTQLMPNKVTWDTVPPTKPDENGFYPVATPGVTKLV
ncbi:dehydrogenase [Verrucomicrobiaceae bacterium SCGC AG-212-N21]|nr:dehydrogenase [Verrucomicrobiaceae bacterium SCGC AG-212-N21]